MQRHFPTVRILLVSVASACADLTPPGGQLTTAGGSETGLSRGGAATKNNTVGVGGGTASGSARVSTAGGRAGATAAGSSGNPAANTGGRTHAGSGDASVAKTGGRSASSNARTLGGSSPTTGGAATVNAQQPDQPGGTSSRGGASPRSRPKPPFFSEYVEGSGNNKALELAIEESGRLEGCVLRIYANGSLSASRSILLTGLLTPEMPLVICSPQLAATGEVRCDFSESLPFNGNDVVLLACDDVVVDVIGQLGNDPGNAGWGDGSLRTQDQTLRRACSVVRGDSEANDVFEPKRNGWIAAKIDAVDGLGVRCEPLTDDGAGGAGGGGAGGTDQTG